MFPSQGTSHNVEVASGTQVRVYAQRMNTPVDLRVGESWVPVEACTLPTTAQPLRLAEFDDLFAQSLITVERPRQDEVRLVLRGPDELRHQVRDLADREAACCSFFSFTVTTSNGDPRSVLVDIAVPANRTDVLSALADRAEAHLAAKDRP